MKENIKIGLLAVIAITLIINTAMDSNNDAPKKALIERAPSNKMVADPNAITIDNITPNLDAQPAKPKTNMTFAETSHSFGKIKQDSENKKIFKFTNTGDKPLVIENAKGSCGCTVPTYPREPIAPGETGDIEVIYKPGKQKGNQQKTVTITANTEPAQTLLYIDAEVQVVE